ncbi:hypothetical protein [Tetragenococcus halophilus]|uniref:hypothetical protein n=1 Tax=Tetragenococcus halophilus TaxID=51669 RepID=UPI0030E8854A
MEILNTEKIDIDWVTKRATIPDEYLSKDNHYKYSIMDESYRFNMKPVGRVYFAGLADLNYTDGTPKEAPLIGGGEFGTIDRYLTPGCLVYTEDQVENLINSRLYEDEDQFKPKITKELETLLTELSENKAKNKAKRAKEMLEKYQVIDKED